MAISESTSASSFSLTPSLINFGAGIISTGLGILTNIENRKAANEAREFDAKLQMQSIRNTAELNALIAEQNIKIIEDQTKFAVAQKRRKSKALLSRQRALFSKAGVEISGTAADVIDQTAVLEEIDAQIIRLSGEQQISNERLQASFDRTRKKQKRFVSKVSTTASTLKGVKDILDLTIAAKEKGVFG